MLIFVCFGNKMFSFRHPLFLNHISLVSVQRLRPQTNNIRMESTTLDVQYYNCLALNNVKLYNSLLNPKNVTALSVCLLVLEQSLHHLPDTPIIQWSEANQLLSKATWLALNSILTQFRTASGHSLLAQLNYG